MKVADKKVDLTQGSIVQGIIAFSLPIVMGELLQNLYNSVDALIVGNLISKNALAAVTVGGVITNMMVNFFNGMSVGTNVVISSAFGAKNVEDLNKKICITFTFSLLLGVVVSLIGIILTPQLLGIAGTQAEYYNEALKYLRIYLIGIIFTVIYNNGAGILRAIGDPQTPFRILSLSCTINVLLDLAFVKLFHMAIAGVALATVFSQGISVFLVYRKISQSQQIHCINFQMLCHNGKETVGDMLSIGMAAGVQSALIGFSNIFVVRYMNLFSAASVAGIGIAQRLDKFIVLPAKAFGITMTTYVSQNLGAKKFERIQIGKRRCLIVALFVTVLLSSIVYLFLEKCVALFSSDYEVMATGVAMMRVLVPMFWIMAVREIYLGILRGYGHSMVPMILSLIGMVGVRQFFLAVTMAGPTYDIRNIYYCYPLAWSATLGLLLAYYMSVRHKMTGLDEIR